MCGLTTPEEPTTSTQTSTETVVDSELFDRKVAEASSLRSTTVEATVEMRRYVQEKNITRHDPLIWWKEHATHPHLQQLARKYLCIPVTSVPAERLFSKVGELISKRSCLKVGREVE